MNLGRTEMRGVVIFFLKILHVAAMLFLILGWLSPVEALLKFHVAFVFVVILQWRFNSGTCLLTNAENYVAGKRSQVKSQQQGQFVKAVLGRFMKSIPSDSQLKILVYAVILVSAGISALRLLN